MAVKAKSVSFAAKPTSKNSKGKEKLKSTQDIDEKDNESKNLKEELSEDEFSSSSENDDEDQDVSQRGLERLMKALGEDGLSELDRAHLGFVTGELNDEDEDSEEDDDDEEEDLEEDDEEDDEEDLAEGHPLVKASNGDSLAASIARSGLVEEEDDEDEDEEDEDLELDAIPLESLSDAALAVLPESVRATRQYREKINNEDALLRIRDSIALAQDGKPLPWIETLSISYPKSIQEELGDSSEAAEDDLKRELEFYKQALYAAIEGRKLADQVNLPFTRPSDYFAEMVKSDEHMERVRQKLLDEKAGLKASEDARKQRELKKFGKKVQVEKQLERQKNKREFEEKVKGLKRKRNGGGLDGADDDGGAGGDDDFDIRLESAMEGKRSSDRGDRRGGKQPKMKRNVRDSKYGFGGKKRHSKENTRESLDDFGGNRRGGRGGRGGARGGSGGGRGGFSSRGSSNRPGKARRASGRK